MIQAFVIVASALLFVGTQDADEQSVQQKRNAELEFMVGEWTTVHELPGRNGKSTTFSGVASIRRTLNGTFVRIEWSGTIEGRGDFSWMLMLNYSPEKKMHNCCLFDPSGGEPGMFYGDWTDENTLVYKASFTEEDGSTTHQRFTFVKVDPDTFTLTRAFSDDGEHYHFEIPGTYTRKKAEPGT